MSRFFLNRERGPAFEQKGNPWKGDKFSKGLTEEIMNGDINGMFHIP
jgi:hypothetical protein